MNEEKETETEKENENETGNEKESETENERLESWSRREEIEIREKSGVMLVLEIFNASRLISFLNFYARVSMEHSRIEQIHTLFAAKY